MLEKKKDTSHVNSHPFNLNLVSMKEFIVPNYPPSQVSTTPKELLNHFMPNRPEVRLARQGRKGRMASNARV